MPTPTDAAQARVAAQIERTAPPAPTRDAPPAQQVIRKA